MRSAVFVTAAGIAFFCSATLRVIAQGPPQGAGAPQGQGRGNAATFPQQQRKLADPAVIERGSTLYGINCRLCHGPDLRGGDMGGVNLLRSQTVLNDQDGELIYPIVHGGLATPGAPPMPPLTSISEEDVKAIAAYIHSVAAKAGRQGGPPPTDAVELNILVGDAAAGQQYFQANCTPCHSATGDLAGIGRKYANPMQLQNTWVSGDATLGRGRGGRGEGLGGGPDAQPGAAGPGPARGGMAVAPTARGAATAVITTADGQRVEGLLDRIDDFSVTVVQPDGTHRTFRRTGAVPKVEIRDPLEGHKKLFVKYTDKDIHDVTAYLVTLK